MITAYTYPYDSVKNRILIDCQISIPNTDDEISNRQKALWDTGAMTTCIATSLADKLKLQATDEVMVVGANNQPFKAPIYSVKITMGKLIIPIHQVIGLPMDGSGQDVIIGMDIISKGDLAITNYSGRTIISFRTPSLEAIDYVGELAMQKKCNKIHELNIKNNRSDKCACGSGKDYKNCHGSSVYNRNKL